MFPFLVPESFKSAKTTEQGIQTDSPESIQESDPPPPPAPRDRFDLRPDAQRARKKAIDEYVKNGMLDRVALSDVVPKVWVSATFRIYPRNAQLDCVSIAYAYACGLNKAFGTNATSFVSIRSSDTRNTIGSYSPSSGLVFVRHGR